MIDRIWGRRTVYVYTSRRASRNAAARGGRGEILTSQTALTYSGGYALSGSLNIIAVGGKIFILTFPDTAHYSGVIPMVFVNIVGLGGEILTCVPETHSHYSGVIPIAYRVFDDDSPRGEILTFPDTLTTQGLSLC